MNKSDIKRTLTQCVGGKAFITRGEIKAIMGWGNDRSMELVKGLDCITAGRTKQYLIDEVAAKIATQLIKG